MCEVTPVLPAVDNLVTDNSSIDERHVATWTRVLHRLDELVGGQPEATALARAHTRWLRDEHFGHLDGRRIYAEGRPG